MLDFIEEEIVGLTQNRYLKPGSTRCYSDEQKKEIIYLRRQGLSYRQIQIKTGIGFQTIANFCRLNGLGGQVGSGEINKKLLEKVR